MTTDKLDTRLVTGDVKKQEQLKFTDYSINKFQSNFSKGQKTIRTKILKSGLEILLAIELAYLAYTIIMDI
ncbi:hypothetical protein N9J74_00510 [Candidatus Pelagibacter sp.]|nr:hypothetical protein [Candidatus Pelagibacter sp.]